MAECKTTSNFAAILINNLYSRVLGFQRKFTTIATKSFNQFPLPPQIKQEITTIITTRNINSDDIKNRVEILKNDFQQQAESQALDLAQTQGVALAQEQGTALAQEQISEDQINKIISTRNNLVSGLTVVYASVTVLQNIVNILQSTLPILEKIPLVLKALPILGQFVPVGVINILSDLLENSKDEIKKLKSDANTLCQVLNQIQEILTFILSLLALLDILTLLFAKNQSIPFEPINDDLNQLSATANQQQQDTQNQTSPGTQQNGVEYKNLTLKVLLDPSNNTSYPLRYAVAFNNQGIQVLRGPSSFSSSTQVLLDELKFEIDQQGITG